MHLQPVAPSLTVSYRRCQCTQRRVSHKAEGVRVAMCLLGPEREAEREGKMVVGARFCGQNRSHQRIQREFRSRKE